MEGMEGYDQRPEVCMPPQESSSERLTTRWRNTIKMCKLEILSHCRACVVKYPSYNPCKRMPF